MRERARAQYEQATAALLFVLGLLFLALYAWPILNPNLAADTKAACATASVAIWIVFVIDYGVRFALATHRRDFVRHNWLDLVIIAVPMLRPLRALRGVVGLRMIARSGGTFARGRIVAAVAVTVAASGAIAALAMLDAERASPDATIHTYGDALWWAASTITTVGYGDRFPVTSEGRLIAGGLMLAGIALLGVITASLASWFVEKVGEVARAEKGTDAALQALRAEIQELRRELYQRPPGDHPDAV